jgi:hypothetical protein
MTYSIWLDGNRIGNTALESSHGQGRRAGVFHPTELGLTVLPTITAMGPALLDVSRICRESGIETEDPDLDIDSATEEVFRTPEGLRALAAARQVARLELHDASGRVVVWDSILITDMAEFAAVVAATSAADPALSDRIGESGVRYFISAKLQRRTHEKTPRRGKRSWN